MFRVYALCFFLREHNIIQIIHAYSYNNNNNINMRIIIQSDHRINNCYTYNLYHLLYRIYYVIINAYTVKTTGEYKT